jgi:cobalamin-dependent methionine synthase I
MYIIGERLNSTRTSVKNALEGRDVGFLLQEAKKQLARGCSAIDLNAAALMEEESESLKWAVPLLQDQFSTPISIDTPNKTAMEAGLKAHRGKAVLNSMTGESRRIADFLPLVKTYRPITIILCMDDFGLPQTPQQELEVASNMAELMDREGIDREDIFLDPLVRPIGADSDSGRLFLDSLSLIKGKFPDIKTIAGISNVSFGLPRRSLINRTFLTLAMALGLDGAILNPLDPGLISAVRAGEALLGRDPMLRNYLSFIRSEER